MDPVLRRVRNAKVIHRFLQQPASGYTQQRQAVLRVVTYNVAGRRVPADFDARPLVLPEGEPEPDIVAVGWQEVVPLNAGNVLIGGAVDAALAWDRRLAAAFNGEQWAARHYGPPEAAVLASMSERWAGGPTAADFAAAGAGAGAAPRAAGSTGPLTRGNPLQHAKAAAAVDASLSKAVAHYSPPPLSAHAQHGQAPQQQQDANDHSGASPDQSTPPPAGPAPPAASAASNSITASVKQLLEAGRYVQVASKQLVGVYASVWVKTEMLQHVSGLCVMHRALLLLMICCSASQRTGHPTAVASGASSIADGPAASYGSRQQR